MNAIVEVATAHVVADVPEVVVAVFNNHLPIKVLVSAATSTLCAVISLGNHSISAVAPDHILEGGLPTAA